MRRLRGLLVINGRWAKDRGVMFAVRRAYKEYPVHVLEQCTVVQRRGDERGAHRVRQETVFSLERLLHVAPEQAVDLVGMQMPASDSAQQTAALTNASVQGGGVRLVRSLAFKAKRSCGA